MTKPLIICEKPDQAQKLADPFPHQKGKGHIKIQSCDVFPDGAIVTNAVGHVLQLKDPKAYDEKWKEWNVENLPIIPPDYQFEYEVDPSKKGLFQEIKKWVYSNDISYIVNAGDPAREGQAIIDEVLTFLNNKKRVKRFWSTSLSKKSVKRTFLNLKDNNDYQHLYQESLARQHADWIIGMNFTRLMTRLIQAKGIQGKQAIFSIGRCQIPLTSIIYDREVAIESFESEPYWDVMATIQTASGTFQAQWFNEKQTHIFQKQGAEALQDICRGKNAYIYDVKKGIQARIGPDFL